MKVENAVQVFSNSVAVALISYAEQGFLEKSEAMPLSEMIKTLNDLFDLFNSTKEETNPLKSLFIGK